MLRCSAYISRFSAATRSRVPASCSARCRPRTSRSVTSAAASENSTPTTAMIQCRFLKKAPPSDAFGATTSVNLPAPNGTTSDAWRPRIGKLLTFVTRRSALRRERPR